MIVGDNGRILRLVGVNGAARTARTRHASTARRRRLASTGGFLNYNYDLKGSTADGYGNDGNRPPTTASSCARSSFLDYTQGGIDYGPRSAATDRGARRRDPRRVGRRLHLRP